VALVQMIGLGFLFLELAALATAPGVVRGSCALAQAILRRDGQRHGRGMRGR
jgi:hypothetical protein